jgi:hypothetical protein
LKSNKKAIRKKSKLHGSPETSEGCHAASFLWQYDMDICIIQLKMPSLQQKYKTNNHRHMKKTLFTAALGAMAISAGAQQITESDLKDIQSSFVMDASTKALQNIITNESNLRKLSLNREIQGETDHYFKYKVDVKGITDHERAPSVGNEAVRHQGIRFLTQLQLFLGHVRKE